MPTTTPTPPFRVTVLGAGFAGQKVALGLSRVPGVEVCVLDVVADAAFQPLLYQIAAGALAPEAVQLPLAAALAAPNVQVVRGTVDAVDLQQRQIRLAQGALPPPFADGWDALVLATGGETAYPSSLPSSRRGLGLHTLADALALRDQLETNLAAAVAAAASGDAAGAKRLRTVCVVGGGPTGVEYAGAVAQRLAEGAGGLGAHRILLLERGPTLLSTYGAAQRDSASARLRALGVDVELGVGVQELDHDGLATSLGRIDAGLVCWAAGAQARSLEISPAEVARDPSQRLMVDACCRIPGFDQIYAIGDMAHFLPTGSLTPLPGVAPVAQQQGACVAANIARALEGAPAEPFFHRNMGQMAVLGMGEQAVVEMGPLKLRGWAGGAIWLAVHLAVLPSMGLRVQVARAWGAYFAGRILRGRGFSATGGA